MAIDIQACKKVRETYDLAVKSGAITQFDDDIKRYLANHCKRDRKINNCDICDYLDAFNIADVKLQYVARTKAFSRVLALALLNENQDSDVKICSANIPFLDSCYTWVECGDSIYDSYFVGVWDKNAWYAVYTPTPESIVITPAQEDELFLETQRDTVETSHNYTNLVMRSHVRKDLPELKYFEHLESDAMVFEYQAASFREWRKVLLGRRREEDELDLPPEFLSTPFIKSVDSNVESGYDSSISKEIILKQLFEFVIDNYDFYMEHREEKPIGESPLVQAYREPGESDLYVVSALRSVPSIIQEMNNKNQNLRKTLPEDPN